jgi:hypothetical protein
MATLDLQGLHLVAISDPTQTTDPAIWQPYSILATNDVWRHGTWVFGANNAAQPTVRIGIYGLFVVPQNYSSTTTNPTIRIHWTATLTSGDVVWDFEYRTVGGDDTTSLDQAGTEESVSVTDTAPGATDRLLTASVALTRTNLAAGELVEFALFRDGADAADTMAGSAILHGLDFRYADA